MRINRLATKLLFGSTSLILRSGEGISDLAGRVHVQFSHLPWLPDTDVEPRIEHAPFPYRVVNHVFKGLRTFIPSRNVDNVELRDAQSEVLNRLIAVTNGIIGDRLAEWENPLSIEFEVLDRNNRSLDPDEINFDESKGIVVFVHGLCMHERDWDSPAFDEFCERMEERGLTVLKVRYNSGKPIFENGDSLRQALEKLSEKLSSIGSITLVGHSMGALASFSAVKQARDKNDTWIDHPVNLVSLAGPHKGAPLEKAGYHSNSLLTLLPFTRPFKDLGLIRSRGIRNLRYGEILPESNHKVDRDEKPLDTVRALLVGSSLHEIGRHTPIGDGMVPVDSALPDEEQIELELHRERIEREHLDEVGHIEIISQTEVYDLIRDWM